MSSNNNNNSNSNATPRSNDTNESYIQSSGEISNTANNNYSNNSNNSNSNISYSSNSNSNSNSNDNKSPNEQSLLSDNDNNSAYFMEENSKTLKRGNNSPVIREAEERILQAFAKHPSTIKITDLFNPLAPIARTKSGSSTAGGGGVGTGTGAVGAAGAGAAGAGDHNNEDGTNNTENKRLLLPPPAYRKKNSDSYYFNQSPPLVPQDINDTSISQKSSDDSIRYRRSSSMSKEKDNDDEVSVLSLPSTKKTITFKETKSAFAEVAELAIMQVIQDIDAAAEEQSLNEDFQQPVLKGVPTEAVQLLETLIADDNIAAEEGDGQVVATQGNHDSVGTSSKSGSSKLQSAAKRLMLIEKLKSTGFTIVETGNDGDESGKESTNLIGKANEVLRLSEMVQQQQADDKGDIDIDDIEKQQGESGDSFNKNGNEEKSSGSRGFRCYCSCRPLQRIFKLIYRTWNAIMQNLYFFVVAEIVLVGVAAFIYYAFQNPITRDASYSWFVLLGARYLVTFELAVLVEAFLIDFLFVETKLAVWFLGRFLTLMAVQAKVSQKKNAFALQWAMNLLILSLTQKPFLLSNLYTLVNDRVGH